MRGSRSELNITIVGEVTQERHAIESLVQPIGLSPPQISQPARGQRLEGLDARRLFVCFVVHRNQDESSRRDAVPIPGQHCDQVDLMVRSQSQEPTTTRHRAE